MGNTPSRDRQENLYASYIKQQQELIHKQQQQINSLYQHNLQNNEFSQNLLHQYTQSQPQSQPQSQSQAQSQQLPQITSELKLDPYKILNIPKNYDKKTLKKAYLKMAYKTHPDRGGSRNDFQKVTIAYTLLKNKLKERENSHSHNDLREMSKGYMQSQEDQPKQNINMKDNFDVNLFNKIYEDNKIKESYDDGYGSWMQENTLKEDNTKLFQSGFNKDMFNHTFEQYKKEKSQQSNSQLVKYQEPEVRISMANQDSLMVLGEGKIADFGGTTDNLSFTDYKQAFTDNSTLIDTSSVDITGRVTSMNGMKKQRSNISYDMTPQQEKIFALQQLEQKKAEEERIQRLQRYDQQTGETYEKIHSLLLR